MVDFLRENTWCSPEQYKWEFTVSQIRLMSYDFTHLEYLNKDKVKSNGNIDKNKGKQVTISNFGDLENISDFGIPIINKPKENT